MADKEKKTKKVKKTYKTPGGAQQIGSKKDWDEASKRIEQDFKIMSAEEFKKKYGANNYKLFRSMSAGWFGAAGAEAKKKKGFTDAAAYAEKMEKKYSRKSKREGYAKGGLAKKYTAKCGASNPPTQKSSKRK